MEDKEKKDKPEEKVQTKHTKEDSSNEFIKELSDSTEQVKKWNFLTHLKKRIRNKKFNPLTKGVTGVIEEYKVFTETKEKAVAKYMAYEAVAANAADTAEYYILLILSCLIATMGLYQDSAAVIIGAMIVAPLMGPILGFSAGVLWGSGKTIWEAFSTLLKGVILVLLFTSGLTFAMPYIPITGQILARTSPGIGDIIVAIASGLVGAYAYVNNKVSSSIPGVAVSVALMPPLCTVGIGIGLWRPEIFQGALLLFVINLIGISLAAVFIFYLVKLHPGQQDQKAKKRFIRHTVITFCLLLAIVIPLSMFTINALSINIEKQQVHEWLKTTVPAEEIYSSEYINLEAGFKLRLILFNPPSEGIKNLKKNLTEKYNRKYGKKLKIEIFSFSTIPDETTLVPEVTPLLLEATPRFREENAAPKQSSPTD